LFGKSDAVDIAARPTKQKCFEFKRKSSQTLQIECLQQHPVISRGFLSLFRFFLWTCCKKDLRIVAQRNHKNRNKWNFGLRHNTWSTCRLVTWQQSHEILREPDYLGCRWRTHSPAAPHRFAAKKSFSGLLLFWVRLHLANWVTVCLSEWVISDYALSNGSEDKAW